MKADNFTEKCNNWMEFKHGIKKAEESERVVQSPRRVARDTVEQGAKPVVRQGNPQVAGSSPAPSTKTSFALKAKDKFIKIIYYVLMGCVVVITFIFVLDSFNDNIEYGLVACEYCDYDYKNTEIIINNPAFNFGEAIDIKVKCSEEDNWHIIKWKGEMEKLRLEFKYEEMERCGYNQGGVQR